VAAFAAAIVLGAGSRIASAQAAGPPQPPDLAAGITEYANSQVDAAMAEPAAVVSQVTGIELPPASPTPTRSVQTTSPPESPATEDTISPLASTGDPATRVAAGPVEIVVAQEPIPPTPLAGAAGWRRRARSLAHLFRPTRCPSHFRHPPSASEGPLVGPSDAEARRSPPVATRLNLPQPAFRRAGQAARVA